MCSTPDISHIIPAHNEERYLPRTLETVQRAIDAFEGTVEVIVVDNVSTDSTAELARRWGAKMVSEERRCIAAVRNAGAAHARGRILTFADADSMISENFFIQASRHLATGKYIGGNFGIRADRTSFAIKLSIWLVLNIIRVLFRVGGGSFFCLRETFEAIGGFNADLDAAEDIAFARALRQYGKSKGLRYLQDFSVYIITSMRKADTLGDWFAIRFMLSAPLLALWPPLLKGKMRDFFYKFDRSKPSKGFS